MIDILLNIEKNLTSLLWGADLHSMYIDYHEPFVKRIWFQHGEYRVFLHRIEAFEGSVDALYHPHQWKSAVRIIKGEYEMGVGHSDTTDIPKTDCKLRLRSGSLYEMTEPDGWHYVKPMGLTVYSLMVTGGKTNRPMPVEPSKEFRRLTEAECLDIILEVNSYYSLLIPASIRVELAIKASK
jgi:hypothetical protein